MARARKRPRADPERAAPLPLALRLPNAPPLVAGRLAEVRWTQRALGRGPVVVLWGLAGMGKTTVALAALHALFGARAEAALRITLPPGEPAEDPRLDVARALASADGRRDVDWSSLAADDDALAAAIVDWAELRERVVLLEDLHHGSPGPSAELLLALAGFARKSRWLVTTRVDPRLADLAGQTQTIGAMADAELLELAEAIDPARAQVLVRAAGGSPRRLLDLLGGAQVAAPRTTLGDLPDDVIHLVRALAPISGPLSAQVIRALAGAAPQPDDESLERLARRGVLEASGAGFRVAPSARGLVVAQTPPAELAAAAERARATLLQHADPVALLEGIRLALEHQRTQDVARVLGARADELLASGYGRELWRRLEHASAPSLESFRLRAALACGSVEVMSRVAPPPEGRLADRLAWVQVLFLRGAFIEAAEAATALQRAGEARGDHHIVFESTLLRARILSSRGERETALAELEAVPLPSASAATRRDALGALQLALLGRHPEAERVALPLVARIASLPLAERRECGATLAQALAILGRVHDAWTVVETVRGQAPPGELGAFTHVERRLLNVRAAVATERGDIAQAREIIARLRPSLPAGSPRGLLLEFADLVCRLHAGDVDGLCAAIDRMKGAANELGHSELADAAEALHLELARITAERPAPNRAIPRAESPGRKRVREMLEMRGRLRCEGSDAVEAEPGLVHSAATDVRAFEHAVMVDRALVQGDAAAAIAASLERFRDANQHGHGLAAAEAAVGLCEAYLVGARRDELARAAIDLDALAARMPSARFSAEARFFSWAASDDLEIAPLEAIAGQPHPTLPAPRRAQALLGCAARLDAIDQVVLRALRARPELRRVKLVLETTGEQAWAPGWGIDERRHSVWRADGSTVDLSSRPWLWQLLAHLAQVGRATKEELVKTVWGERQYHPLRHDNRLRVTVRKLREAIELDPKSAAYLITVEEGYAVTGKLRRAL